MARAPQPLPDSTLGDFVIKGRLGEGGHGAVFLAEQRSLARHAVVKVAHARGRGDDAAVRRFLHEARLASRVDHPYAAHVYAFGAEEDGLLWIAMEHVRGTPLDRLLLLQGPLPLERFVPFFERLCEVVQSAHEQGIVHRDLKPANVMVISRSGRLIPKLCDLGIAKLVGADDGEPAAGAVVGSPLYMAPEQWANADAVDARSDIYALGVLAFEALAGRVPYDGLTRLAVAAAHKSAPVPALGPGFPPALDDAIARALAKRPEQRFASALELAAAIRAASGTGADAPRPPQLDAEVRERVLAESPQPIAEAVAVLDSARNAHQARDAVRGIVRATSRYLGLVALACHTRGRSHADPDAEPVAERLRALRRRLLATDEWLELATELVRRFAPHRDAHPIPELVSLFFPFGDEGRGPAPFGELARLDRSWEDDAAADDARLRGLLETAMADVARLLRATLFLCDYRLVVPRRDGGEKWMGIRRSPRAAVPLGPRALEDGRPVLVDALGHPVVSLWPFMQVAAPTPGAPDELFLLAGHTPRGARLVSPPTGFERHDPELWDWCLEHLVAGDGAEAALAAEPEAPYRGLASFRAEDSALFLGREAEIQAFVNRLRVQPLLAVLGPSGVGKSSFLHAGVVPALPPDWLVLSFRPGFAPLAALAARVGGAPADAAALVRAVRDAARKGGCVLLIVDQFEETFTLCPDAEERQRFAAVLAELVDGAGGAVRVVLTMRDDFLLRAERLAAFRDRLAPALELLTVPAPDDLRRILVEPARRAGYDFDDPRLPDEIVRAVTDHPSALPLLSFTAAELWKVRDRHFKQLRRKSYEAMGGVGGALAQHAEATLARLAPEQRRVAREAFRHLVTSEGTRAVLERAELVQILGGGHAEAVIEGLVGARLLTAQETDDGMVVEIAHEALLDAWPRLAEWRREDAEGARFRAQLRQAARQWDERGRAPGRLWRGEALAEYQLWRARFEGTLSDAEEGFAAASLAEAARGRRLRRFALAAAFALLAGALVVLVSANRRVVEQRARAEAALSEEYADEGRQALLQGDVVRAMVFLDAAYRRGLRRRTVDFLLSRAWRDVDGVRATLAHGDAVLSAKFSPDGRTALTASRDGTARLWDAASGALLRTFSGHRGGVGGADFSPDGRRVVTAGLDGTVRVWDALAGDQLMSIPAHTGGVWRASYSPDGARLVTAGRDFDAKLWDAADGRAIASLRGHRAEVSAAGFSPDGTRIATASLDGTARLWSADGRALVELVGHAAPIRFATFGPDGNVVVTGDARGTVILWDGRTGARLHVLAAHAGHVLGAAFGRDGRRLLTFGQDATAKVWDAAGGTLVRSLGGHRAEVSSAAFSPDGLTILTTSFDGTARLWDARNGAPLRTLAGHTGTVWSGTFDRSGELVLTAGLDGSARVWEARVQAAPGLVGHEGEVWSASFGGTGARAVTAGGDGTVRVWDAASGRQVAARKMDGAAFYAALAPDDGRAAIASGSEAVVWTIGGGAPDVRLAGHGGVVGFAAFSPDGARVLTTSDDGTARTWDAATGRQLATFRGHAAPLSRAAFSADGARIATAGYDGSARVWDAASGALLVTLAPHAGPLLGARFDPGGDRLVTAGTDRLVRVWDARTGRELHVLGAHKDVVTAASFSADGRIVLSSSRDGTVKLWDADAGTLLWSLGGQIPLNDGSFDPTGASIVTGGEDGSAQMWDVADVAGAATLVHQWLPCHANYRLEDGHLVGRSSPAGDCSSQDAPRRLTP